MVLELQPPQEATQGYGCPATLIMRITLPDDRPMIDFDLQWFGKPACRLAEALWLSFSPKVEAPDAWKMEKLGSLISPLEVVPNGNRHLHAVGKGFRDAAQPDRAPGGAGGEIRRRLHVGLVLDGFSSWAAGLRPRPC